MLDSEAAMRALHEMSQQMTEEAIVALTEMSEEEFLKKLREISFLDDVRSSVVLAMVRDAIEMREEALKRDLETKRGQ